MTGWGASITAEQLAKSQELDPRGDLWESSRFEKFRGVQGKSLRRDAEGAFMRRSSFALRCRAHQSSSLKPSTNPAPSICGLSARLDGFLRVLAVLPSCSSRGLVAKQLHDRFLHVQNQRAKMTQHIRALQCPVISVSDFPVLFFPSPSVLRHHLINSSRSRGYDHVCLTDEVVENSLSLFLFAESPLWTL